MACPKCGRDLPLIKEYTLVNKKTEKAHVLKFEKAACEDCVQEYVEYLNEKEGLNIR